MKKVRIKASRGDWKPYALTTRPVTSADILIMLGLLLAGGWFVWSVHSRLAYDWNWKLLLDFLIKKNAQGQWIPGLILSGLLVTIKLSLWSIGLAFVIGACVGIPAAHKKGLSALPARLYANTVRNIPPLVLLFFLYFFIGSIMPMAYFETTVRTLPAYAQKGVATFFAPIDQLDRMITAVVTLGVYEGAYMAEIIRAGLESVPREQWETSSALGFSKYIQLRYIIFPQAFAYMTPSLIGQSISTLKDSALASLISLPELTFQSLETMAVSRMTFETWVSTACLYLLLGFTCSQFGKLLENKTWRWKKEPRRKGFFI